MTDVGRARLEIDHGPRGGHGPLVARPRAVPESTATLVRGAVDDVRELAQAELALVKLEVGERITTAREQLAHTLPRLAAGGALASMGAVATLVGAVLLLDVWLQAWAAWLIVGLACSIGGAILLLRAMPRPAAEASLLASPPPVALGATRGSEDG
jgi:hypothetical protein